MDPEPEDGADDPNYQAHKLRYPDTERQASAEERLAAVRHLAEGWAAYVLTESDTGSAAFERIEAVRECAVALLKVIDGAPVAAPEPRVRMDPLGVPTEYTCLGCDKPIAKGERMIGSDVFGIYSHVECEEETKRKYIAANPTPEPDEDTLARAQKTLGRYANDPRFAAQPPRDPLDGWPDNIGDCQSPPARTLHVPEAIDDEPPTDDPSER